MDHRRPIRPTHTAAAPRRPLFHPTSTSSSHPSRANSRATNPSKTSTVHISPDDPNTTDDDLVERDTAGNYKIMAPSTAMKMGIEPPISAEQEEKEQEDQIIAMYGKSKCHWDQAAVLEEIKGALKSSLERAVTSLETDRWMFEGESGRKI